MVILDAEDDAELGKARGRFAERVGDQFPLPAVVGGGIVVAGEYADGGSANVLGEPREFDHVLGLNLAMGDFAVLHVGGEISVAGKHDVLELGFFQMRTQGGAFGFAIVQGRDGAAWP
jgi:hypothetical protein